MEARSRGTGRKEWMATPRNVRLFGDNGRRPGKIKGNNNIVVEGRLDIRAVPNSAYLLVVFRLCVTRDGSE
jgi:hypothetical protein